MTNTQVAVFLSKNRLAPFASWASLVADQVVVMHLQNDKLAQQKNGVPCVCVIKDPSGARDTVSGVIRRTTYVSNAPAVVYLDRPTRATPRRLADARLDSENLEEVKQALLDFVAVRADKDPARVPSFSPSSVSARSSVSAGSALSARSSGLSARSAARSTSLAPDLPLAQKPDYQPGKKPFWCKLFRGGPGC